MVRSSKGRHGGCASCVRLAFTSVVAQRGQRGGRQGAPNDGGSMVGVYLEQVGSPLAWWAEGGGGLSCSILRVLGQLGGDGDRARLGSIGVQVMTTRASRRSGQLG
ncbi:hypothetical protein E2562_026070 [Oryza meyeriana var. granulata]|uniref:Uncharacterized protein n=1 Tax=Oryza meyeriana var. granulata TaxID=110450 RepID=A0A6G1E2P2_9ORYZ|nr:hypothetical protein E2562_026070 [Oryza meyeriana var. granulata]